MKMTGLPSVYGLRYVRCLLSGNMDYPLIICHWVRIQNIREYY
jgi:hypothetical protein